MAHFKKPSKIPRWADTGTVVEPSEAKKNSGWVNLEKPPFSFFNYLHKLTGDWFKWIDERFADGRDENELIIKGPATGNAAIRIRTDGAVTFGQPLHAPDYKNAFKVGDADFNMYLSGSYSYVSFGPDDQIRYDRANDRFSFRIDGTNRLRMGRDRIDWLVGERYFGFHSSEGNQYIDFGKDDYLVYNSKHRRWSFLLGGIPNVKLSINNMGIDGIGGLQLFALFSDGKDPFLVWDGGDFIRYDRGADNWLFKIGNSTEMSLDSHGLRLAKGLHVGGTDQQPHDNDIVCEGGLAVGFDGDPGTGEVQIHDQSFKLCGGSVPKLQFDEGASIGFDRDGRQSFDWVIASSKQMRLSRVPNQGASLELFDDAGTPCQISARSEGLVIDRPIQPALDKPNNPQLEDKFLSQYNLVRTVAGNISGSSGHVRGHENDIKTVTRIATGTYMIKFKHPSWIAKIEAGPTFFESIELNLACFAQARSGIMLGWWPMGLVTTYVMPCIYLSPTQNPDEALYEPGCTVILKNENDSLVDCDFSFIAVGL